MQNKLFLKDEKIQYNGYEFTFNSYLSRLPEGNKTFLKINLEIRIMSFNMTLSLSFEIKNDRIIIDVLALFIGSYLCGSPMQEKNNGIAADISFSNSIVAIPSNIDTIYSKNYQQNDLNEIEVLLDIIYNQVNKKDNNNE